MHEADKADGEESIFRLQMFEIA